MDKKVLGFLIVGGRAVGKLEEKELESFDEWFTEYKKQIESEMERKLKKKEEERVYKLILGIIVKCGVYDERYYKYLLGEVVSCE